MPERTTLSKDNLRALDFVDAEVADFLKGASFFTRNVAESAPYSRIAWHPNPFGLPEAAPCVAAFLGSNDHPIPNAAHLDT